MANSPIQNLLSIVLPNLKVKGVGNTPTFQPQQAQNILTLPTYQDHLSDIFDDRIADNVNDLVDKLSVNDPDFSATINAYLTIADTEFKYTVLDENDQIDRDGMALVEDVLQSLTERFDYKQGFQLKPDLSSVTESMRYMVLIRGACASELVLDKKKLPTQIRQIDPKSIRWKENESGTLKPEQVVDGQNENTSLDIASFFMSFFRRNPTNIYTQSPFVSAVNTIAARQQVVNDLYRIMRITGFPRISLEVVEEVLVKSAPEDIRQDQKLLRDWINSRMTEISTAWASLRPDQVFAHTDAVKPSMINENKPGASLDVSKVIEVLNAQNQAALKVMSTIIGRGDAGVNTASVEARVFSMNADALNKPVAETLSNILTLAIRLSGSASRVIGRFQPAELRPITELEPQFALKQSRLLKDLSYGLITDDEYHLEMYGRLAPDGVPTLSGTGFLTPETVGVDEEKVSPNGGPIERGLTPDE